MAATLYLLPNRIAETDFSDVLPEKSLAVLRRTRRFLAENARSARRFLKAAGHPDAIDTLEIIEIGHAPDAVRFDEWLTPLTSDDASTPPSCPNRGVPPSPTPVRDSCGVRTNSASR